MDKGIDTQETSVHRAGIYKAAPIQEQKGTVGLEDITLLYCYWCCAQMWLLGHQYPCLSVSSLTLASYEYRVLERHTVVHSLVEFGPSVRIVYCSIGLTFHISTEFIYFLPGVPY